MRRMSSVWREEIWHSWTLYISIHHRDCHRRYEQDYSWDWSLETSCMAWTELDLLNNQRWLFMNIYQTNRGENWLISTNQKQVFIPAAPVCSSASGMWSDQLLDTWVRSTASCSEYDLMRRWLISWNTSSWVTLLSLSSATCFIICLLSFLLFLFFCFLDKLKSNQKSVLFFSTNQK